MGKSDNNLSQSKVGPPETGSGSMASDRHGEDGNHGDGRSGVMGSPPSVMVVQVDSLLRELIPGFIENRRNEVQLLRSLLAAEDYVQIQRLGHSLKGSAAGYGFMDLAEMGRVLEGLAKGRDDAQLHKVIDDYEASLGRIQVAFV